jgi:hypothetical protein
MILRWEQGRATIDGLLAKGRLTPVTANRDLADLMLTQARGHLVSAATIVAGDPRARSSWPTTPCASLGSDFGEPGPASGWRRSPCGPAGGGTCPAGPTAGVDVRAVRLDATVA